MANFTDYDQHTRAMILWMIDRWTQDEVLAGATPHPRLVRAFLSIDSQRDGARDYFNAADKAIASTGVRRWRWEAAARFHAFTLRRLVGAWWDRDGYDPAWCRAPRG